MKLNNNYTKIQLSRDENISNDFTISLNGEGNENTYDDICIIVSYLESNGVEVNDNFLPSHIVLTDSKIEELEKNDSVEVEKFQDYTWIRSDKDIKSFLDLLIQKREREVANFP